MKYNYCIHSTFILQEYACSALIDTTFPPPYILLWDDYKLVAYWLKMFSPLWEDKYLSVLISEGMINGPWDPD